MLFVSENFKFLQLNFNKCEFTLRNRILLDFADQMTYGFEKLYQELFAKLLRRFLSLQMICKYCFSIRCFLLSLTVFLKFFLRFFQRTIWIATHNSSLLFLFSLRTFKQTAFIIHTNSIKLKIE